MVKELDYKKLWISYKQVATDRAKIFRMDQKHFIEMGSTERAMEPRNRALAMEQVVKDMNELEKEAGK
ncbi:MAG: hypothetical protein ACTSPV_16685 [Candidatus Hodarchaeales archaeon]